MTLEERVARLELQLDKLSKGTPVLFGEAPPPTLVLQGGQENGQPEKVVQPDPRFSQAITQTVDMSEILKAAGARDWEILELRATSKVFVDMHRKGDGLYGRKEGGDGWADLNSLLEKGACVRSGDYIIHSVRRLSDNTTWTVGDKVETGDYGKAEIQGFRIEGDIMLANLNIGFLSITMLSHVLKPLFTTADGVQVYKGDTVYTLWVDGKDQYTGNITPGPTEEMGNDHLQRRSYSTEVAAQAGYTKWLWTQPVLSLNDVVDDPEHASHLEALVKKKLSSK